LLLLPPLLHATSKQCFRYAFLKKSNSSYKQQFIKSTTRILDTTHQIFWGGRDMGCRPSRHCARRKSPTSQQLCSMDSCQISILQLKVLRVECRGARPFRSIRARRRNLWCVSLTLSLSPPLSLLLKFSRVFLACTYTYTHKHTHTHIHTCTRAHTHTHTRSTYTRTHAYTHTHTHTHTQKDSSWTTPDGRKYTEMIFRASAASTPGIYSQKVSPMLIL